MSSVFCSIYAVYGLLLENFQTNKPWLWLLTYQRLTTDSSTTDSVDDAIAIFPNITQSQISDFHFVKGDL